MGTEITDMYQPKFNRGQTETKHKPTPTRETTNQQINKVNLHRGWGVFVCRVQLVQWAELGSHIFLSILLLPLRGGWAHIELEWNKLEGWLDRWVNEGFFQCRSYETKPVVCCVSDLQFGNMYLSSLWAALKDSLAWRAFRRSHVPYWALRLERGCVTTDRASCKTVLSCMMCIHS